jgi:hypothetical protein
LRNLIGKKMTNKRERKDPKSILDLLGLLRRRAAQLPRVERIPGAKVERIRKNADYFGIHVRELFLAETGRWWTEYEPMVFVSTEYSYGGNWVVVPFVVGPSLIKSEGMTSPKGMLFHDTQVAGWAPFRGGKVALTVMLYRVKKQDYAHKLLGVLESLSAAIDFGADVDSYLKVVRPIMDGVNALLDLGDTEPLVGERIEFDSEQDEGFNTGDVAIVNNSSYPRAGEEFRVRSRRLHYGKVGEAEQSEFRECDFVLYSISRTSVRDDVDALSFGKQKDDAVRAAMGPAPEDWDRAKAQLLALYRAMVLSADLVPEQISQLFAEYKAEVVKRHEDVLEISETLSVNRPSGSVNETQSELQKLTASILGMN